MLKHIELFGEKKLALVLDGMCIRENAIVYHDAIADVFEACITDSNVKDAVSADSCFAVLRLIKKFLPMSKGGCGALTNVERDDCEFGADVAVVLDDPWDEADEHLYRDALVNICEACMNGGCMDDGIAVSLSRVLSLIRQFCTETDGLARIKVAVDEGGKGGEE